MFAGLWPIFEHYLFGFGLAGGCLLFFFFSAALQAQVSSIPFIGSWLGDNIKHIRDWALLGAVLAFSATLIYAHGVSNGETRVKAEWKAAEQAAIQQGTKARASAERSVKRVPDGMRNDPNNRDD